MPLSFPSSPSVGATSTQNGRQYVFRGNNVWELAGGGSGEDTLLRSLFVPPAPTSVSASAGNAQATVSWTAPSGVISQAPITDYTVQYSSNSGSTWTTFTRTATTATTAVISSLTNGTAYQFRVAAVNAVGTGSYSTASSAVTVSAPTDPYFSSVSLLLHADGSGSTFVDSSPIPKTITAVGDATQSATQSRWGSKSIYLDGSGDYLDVPLSSALQFGTGDFTIEWWLYLVARDSNGASIWNNYSSFTSGALAFFAGHSNGSSIKYQVACNGTFPAIQSNANVTYNQWDHFALVRSGNTMTLYINGVADGSISVAGVTLDGVGNTFRIGSAQDAPTNYETNGYIDDLRITKGVARTITVPTAAFPDA